MCLLLILLILSFHNHLRVEGTETKSERDALLSFKSQVSDPMNRLSSWGASVNSSYCSWYGVSCFRNRRNGTRNNSRGRVKSLSLPGLSLSGKLPSQLSQLTYLHSLDLSYNKFEGQVSLQFAHLSRLRLIQLAANNLSGKLPEGLGLLKHLQFMDLSVNNLTGEVPNSFGNLSSLVHLALARNKFLGQIPSEFCNLQSLHHLQISENCFNGQFPTCIFNISSLEFISVTKNNLSGTLPQDVGLTLPNLKNLSLASNRFQGVIPSSISNASNLEIFDLANNEFHGLIPLFSNMKSLTRLVLGNNYLSSTTSLNYQLFDSLRNSTKLTELMIYSNQLAGQLPATVSNISRNLQHFCVADNSLTGNIPHGMRNFKNLQSLSLEMNEFTGELPTEIGKLYQLVQISIYQNRLSGEIPDMFGNLTQLSYLLLGNNQFTGKVPISIGQCQRLRYLYLGMNKLHGRTPDEIFSLPGLTQLYLAGNGALHGSLPSQVSSMKQLEILDISDNQFSGHIPKEISECSSLKRLILARNNFSGSIPSSMGTLLSLETLDLSSNNLSGPIPQSLEKPQYLMSLNLSFNHLEGQVPMKGVFMNFSWASLRGNNNLCSINTEIAHMLGISLCPAGRKKRTFLLPTILAVAGAAALFIMILCIVWVMRSRKKKVKTSLSSAPLKGFPPNISYADIRVATNNFAAENLVGKGGFGNVYKGMFSINTGDIITLAVKVLDFQKSKASRSFNAECEALRNARHRNLVKVISSCSSVDYKGDEFKALVMQFMCYGNVDTWLHQEDEESGSFLSLLQRLNIAVDVASAVDYLHHDCDPPIVHCDLKPANVLLDENMVAHVGDFGLSRILSQNPSQNESSTLGLKGSIGYVAPEYGLGGRASTSGDVYSFGILLLEIFTARRPTDEMFKEGLNLSKFAAGIDEHQVLHVADPRLLKNFEHSSQSTSNAYSSEGNSSERRSWQMKAEECLASAIRVGLSCAAPLPKDRSTMRVALTKLQAIRQSM
ncbi:hypothetical protein L6164_016383 [Bauhinia variegata]|uniref:Uncharacterized protein n=1 Tax=Bauhinia variegata TaxID=167791 RepID=A0ACB9NQW4_BAUVA|nr:hypothetical protein L6164_016383 [Bauhinia variegata]